MNIPVSRSRAVERVQVVIPCFNDGAYLLEALESLGPERAQGEGIIVVNDGSTDTGTLRLLQLLRERGFRIIDQPNLGLPAARNAGWRACSAPYVLFLDADNRVSEDLPDRAADLLDREGAAVAYTDREEFGQAGRSVVQRMPSLPDLLIGNRVDACAVVRRTVLEEVGGYDGSMVDGYEDWDLWIRMLSRGHAFVHMPDAGFSYRVREGSMNHRLATDPEVRGRAVGRLVAKHSTLFAAHASAVVRGLHQVQAYDHARSVSLEAGLHGAKEELQRERDGRMHREEEHQASLLELRGTIGELRMAAGAMDRRLEERESELQAARMRLVGANRDKETMVEEAHRLVGEVDKAMRALDVQRDHARGLHALIGQYEERIRAMESGRLWRMRRAWYRMVALLRTGSGTPNQGFRWLRRIAFMVSNKGRRIIRRFLAKVFKALYLWTEVRPVRIVVGGDDGSPGAVVADQVIHDPYRRWILAHGARTSDLAAYREDALHFSQRPLVSVVMPVYDPPIAFLEAAIRSVMAQTYDRWELCMADDRSTDPEVRRTLERWSREDDRIKVVFRTSNGHISQASNSALDLAEGTFVALMDHDDLLAPDALHHVVRALEREPGLDLIYTDEDKVDENDRRSEPHFKPQWCPDHLLSRNYFGHLVVLRASIVREIGGFREGFEGSQDYDLLLRYTERTQRVHRIPKVLYHWRVHAGSAARGEDVKPYAYDAAKRALDESLVRRGEPADVSFLPGFRGYGVRFKRPLEGRVSVIIPTRDKADVLGTCLRSLFKLTDHPDLDVLVISNNSREKATVELLDGMQDEHAGRFRWIAHDEPFNFSGLMNLGARHTTGDHILYLNNDTEVIHADWMRAMHEWSQRPGTGAVGAKLLYHNDTIQHGGVVIGLGGVAGHVFTGTHKDGPGYFNYVNTINNYSALTAACLMVERAKLDRIGGWDELFTVEYNDVDLCLRLREAGYHNVYLPHVSLYHYESLTRGHPHMTKESYERHLREVRLFQERWEGYVKDDPCYNPNLTRGAHDWRIEA